MGRKTRLCHKIVLAESCQHAVNALTSSGNRALRASPRPRPKNAKTTRIGDRAKNKGPGAGPLRVGCGCSRIAEEAVALLLVVSRGRAAAAARGRGHCGHADADGYRGGGGYSGCGSCTGARAACARRGAARRAAGSTFAAALLVALRHGDVGLIGALGRLPALRERRVPRRQRAQCDDGLQCWFHDTFVPRKVENLRVVCSPV